MPDTIRDGTGKGYLAKVNANHRMYANAVTQTEIVQATKKGRSYNINTGTIELTNATQTPVLYLKNNESEAIHIDALAVGLGPTTGGSGGIPSIVVVRNPTTGTIIDGATDVDMNSNRNYASSNTLDALAYKGATGNTMTDGDDHILLYQTTSSRLLASIDNMIPTGSSLGVKITPQAGNTSMNCYVALICHLEDVNE